MLSFLDVEEARSPECVWPGMELQALRTVVSGDLPWGLVLLTRNMPRTVPIRSGFCHLLCVLPHFSWHPHPRLPRRLEPADGPAGHGSCAPHRPEEGGAGVPLLHRPLDRGEGAAPAPTLPLLALALPAGSSPCFAPPLSPPDNCTALGPSSTHHWCILVPPLHASSATVPPGPPLRPRR